MDSVINHNEIKIGHNAGFFSCCSIILNDIIAYYNYRKELPKNIDRTNTFAWYKPTDISFNI